MAKTIFSIIVVVHGLIHLLGFAKAFHYGNITHLTKEISKPAGAFWLLTCLLFLAAVIFYISNKNFWPIIALISVIVSQIIIISSWHDAKFGTIANIIVLLVALPAFGNYLFENMVAKEREELLKNISPPSSDIISNQGIIHLPGIVQKWLKSSGVIKRPRATFVRLKQKGEMKIKPDGNWMSFTAEQYFDVKNPSFIWTTRVEMMPFIYLNGRDRLLNGEGEMLIKLLSLINVVNEGHNEKMNPGTMLRYLGEACWFPSAALNNYIVWEEIDSLTAKATMIYKNESVFGIFKFKENGEMISFEADRYFGGSEEAKLERWLVETIDYKVMDGYRIPYKNKVTWKLKEGDFNFLNLEIIDFNVNKFELYE
jgi:hypothetical protein